MIISVFVLTIYIIKIKAVKMGNEVFEEIEAKYIESNDGRVYCDFRFNIGEGVVEPCVYVLPWSGFYGTPFFSKQLNKEHNMSKPLQICPTEMAEGDVKNRAIDIGRGYYYLLQDKAHPADFTVEREYNFIFFTHPCSEIHVSQEQFVNECINEDENYRAIVIHKSMPFINNTGVVITER